MFTQISLLLLYKRVFTLYRIWFRNTLAVIAFLALTSNISMVLANVFACSPISAAWDKNSVTIHCIDITRLAITHAALTLVVDAAIVIAPLPLVWSLNTDRQTKVAVSGMILLGSLSVLGSQSCSADRLLTDRQSLHRQSDQDLLFFYSFSWGRDMLIPPNPSGWPFLTTFQQMTLMWHPTSGFMCRSA